MHELTPSPAATSLQTSRLLLRRWRSDDLDGFAATAGRLANYQQHWDEHGFGQYAVEVKETGELAGFAGLAVPTFLPEIMPAVEIGWRLGRAYPGPGPGYRVGPGCGCPRPCRSRPAAAGQHPHRRQRGVRASDGQAGHVEGARDRTAGHRPPGPGLRDGPINSIEALRPAGTAELQHRALAELARMHNGRGTVVDRSATVHFAIAPPKPL